MSILHVSPSQAKTYQRFQNMRYIEVPYEDATHVYQPQLSMWRPLKELKKRKFENGTFTAEYHFMKDVPHERAIEEFEAFISEWRAKGWGELADKIETRTGYEDDYPTVEILTRKVPDVIFIEIPDAKFYVYREATEEELQKEHEERMRLRATAPEGSYLTPEIMEKAFQNLKARTGASPSDEPPNPALTPAQPPKLL